MAALISSGHLPGMFPPFAWEPVRVTDSRVPGRTMTMYLITKEVRVPDEMTRPTTSATIPFKTQKIVCSPLVSYNDPDAIYEVVTFNVVDPRFASSTVQVCFTFQEALAFRQSIKSASAARNIVASGDKIMRLKCYIQDCVITSSKVEKIEAHFLTDHPNIRFEPQRVKVYQFGGPGDPSVIRTSSAGYSSVPPAKSNPVTALLESQNTPSTGGGIKRRRGPGVTDLHIPVKASRRDVGPGSITGAFRAMQRHGSAATLVASPSESANPQGTPVQSYKRKDLIRSEVPADDKELLCVCFKPEDGRLKIECDNGEECLLRWYHIDCVGLTEDDLPGEDDVWYCPRCVEQGNGGAAAARSTDPLSLEFLQPQSIKARIEQGLANSSNGKGKAAKYPGGFSRDTEVPKPSPSVDLNPWTAPFVKALVDEPDNIKDFDLESLEQARAALLALSKAPIGRPKSPPGGRGAQRQDRWGRLLTAAGTLKTPNSRSWSKEEEENLKQVVEECVAQGLSGEPLWRAAHPKLVARGVNRPIGGMKMRWCRGLREETKIDERRKKNKRKMITALQGPKVNKDSNAPKKGRFKGKGMGDTDALATASSPIRKSTGDLTPFLVQTAPISKFSSFDVEREKVREDSPDSMASDESIVSDLAQSIRRRARSV